jgi:hypothetical protein
MHGSDKLGYSATKLAIDIATSPLEDRTPLLRSACLKPKVFAVLFETYHGDDVSIAKLRQQAATAKVHPDELENCAEIFTNSAVHAGLAYRSGDQIQLVSAKDAGAPAQTEADQPVADVDDDEGGAEGVQGESVESGEAEPMSGPAADEFRRRVVDSQHEPPQSARAVIHVNVTLDSSLDTDKLEKQLSLLRKFGAI